MDSVGERESAATHTSECDRNLRWAWHGKVYHYMESV